MKEALLTPLLPPEVFTDGRDDLAAMAGDKSGESSLPDEDDYSEEQKPEQPDDSEEQKPEHADADADAAADDKSGGKRAAPSSKPIIAGPSHVDERTKNRDLQIDNLREESRRFADYAAGTSMAYEAVSFLRAVEEFNTGKQRTKKIMETELSKTGRFLCAAADRAPASEAGVAAVAVKITGDSLDILLSSEDRASTPCAFLRPWLDRLRAALSGPEPTLPLHLERQEKQTDKRQALFGVALAALLALVTTAAGVKVFPPAFGPWIARIGALLWIAVSCGLVIDLYGNTKLEFQLATCLSRVGMMGVTILFCLFIFGAFFPSATNTMWFLVGVAVALHAFLCVVSRKRGDDQASTSAGEA